MMTATYSAESLDSAVLFCEGSDIKYGGSMKTNLDKFFKTSEALEKNGVWFEISDKIGFLLKPFKATNPKVKSAMATHYKPYAKQVEMGTLDLDKQQEIQIKIFIDVCLEDWRGVEIDGQEVECSPENAHKFFKALPELFDTLWRHANDFSNYREDLGNS